MSVIDEADRRARSAPPTLPTVLFVDDEEAVLSGLRLSLRRHRHDYRLLFASGADQAIALLEAESVDMVVTDMGMPDRNGADLLEEVRFRFPDVVRYVLSGQVGDRLVRRSVAVTHRWLDKPCQTEVLVAALAEVTGHRARILDPQVRRAVGAVDALPSHPVVHAGLLELFGRSRAADDRATVRQVAALAVGDPAFSAKLLQLANSVYVGDGPIHDVGRAAERIGLEALGQLVLANDIVRPFTASEVIPGLGIDLFHRHARAVANLAAGLTSPDQAGLAAAGGLLSQVGLLVEVGHLRDRLDLAYQRAIAEDVDLSGTEEAIFGADNSELGSHLLTLWGLPPRLVEVVAESNRLPELDRGLPLDPIEAVRSACLLAKRLPLARAIGSPHLRTLDDGMAAALDHLQAELDAAAPVGPDQIPNH